MSKATECKFDLQPLYCIDCNAFVGNLGTCEDWAWCEACNSKRLVSAKRSGYDIIYSPQHESDKPPMRASRISRQRARRT